MAQNRKLNYNQKYFKERDHLDLHLAQSLKIFADEKKVKSILDVGCGTGRLVEFLNKNGYEACGCDISEEVLKIAQKLNPNKIKKGQAQKLPYPKNLFDMVTAISVLEHLTKNEAKLFILESKRVLRKNGLLFIITPNFSSPFRLLFGKRWFGYSDPTHRHFYTPETLYSQLCQNGFREIRFRFKTAYNVKFDWYLPSFCRKLPMPAKNVLNYLMISSPLATFRDSLWVCGQK